MKDFAGRKIRLYLILIFTKKIYLIGIVKSEKTMKKFAESAIKYLRKHKFDGLDLGK